MGGDESPLLADWFDSWVDTYKLGVVRDATLSKYRAAQRWVRELAGDVRLSALTRARYQKLLNDYAATHERVTVMDFHHQLKGSVLDAVDEGLVSRDPCRRLVIKGIEPKEKKPKYLSRFELQRLLSVLDLGDDVSWDWLVLFVAKTGLRLSEALAVTPADFDLMRQCVRVRRSWDYKGGGGFAPVKCPSSVRSVEMDWQLTAQMAALVRGMDEDVPLFVPDGRRVYASTINANLARLCRKAGVSVITMHGLRHTHASVLFASGVSVASVSRRLGHSSVAVTEKVYVHLIRELEQGDVDAIMRCMAALAA